MEDWSKVAVEFGDAELDLQSLQAMAKELAYEGLDPAAILKYLAEKNPSGWKNDAKYIIVFALTRGNKIEKASKKMSDKGKEKIIAIQSTYHLQEKASDRMAITPVRVAQSLPTWTCSAAAALLDYLPVSYGKIKERVGTYPPEMMCMAFGSLIPHDIEHEYVATYMDAYSIWQDAFTRVINPQLRSATKQAVYETFKDPLHAAVNSSFFPTEARKRFLKAKGLMSNSGRPSDAVVAAAQHYKMKA
ncbi:nucleocapsid protein [Zwiesel bat bandavirus]|uniref:Nucleoprotein n=1 Tax=Zwiesel bat bandavirus TaxID=3071326 RepID=A0A6C0MAZ5_9VIRU|nr:nucleocapsid protein [Zwiesel bat bandavirus]QHU78997.1 nucleocapsid protein [Zwiesel bat bandavirus]